MNALKHSLCLLNGLSWPKVLGLIAAMAGAMFLFREYQAEIIGLLPFLVFLLCPLMHLFMHKGHGGHDHEKER